MTVSKKLTLARHMVALPVAFLFLPYESYWIGWFAAILTTVIVAAIFAGLALLFFTERQRGKSMDTFIKALWVIGFFVATGTWMVVWPPAMYAPLVALVALIFAKARSRRVEASRQKGL